VKGKRQQRLRPAEKGESHGSTGSTQKQEIEDL
jgi:hypothetical protein